MQAIVGLTAELPGVWVTIKIKFRINGYTVGTFLWGQITGQDEIRDLGAYLYTIESEAIEQYWFDVDNEVFQRI